jgi:hypothetical protein
MNFHLSKSAQIAFTVLTIFPFTLTLNINAASAASHPDSSTIVINSTKKVVDLNSPKNLTDHQPSLDDPDTGDSTKSQPSETNTVIDPIKKVVEPKSSQDSTDSETSLDDPNTINDASCLLGGQSIGSIEEWIICVRNVAQLFDQK